MLTQHDGKEGWPMYFEVFKDLYKYIYPEPEPTDSAQDGREGAE